MSFDEYKKREKNVKNAFGIAMSDNLNVHISDEALRATKKYLNNEISYEELKREVISLYDRK